MREIDDFNTLHLSADGSIADPYMIGVAGNKDCSDFEDYILNHEIQKVVVLVERPVSPSKFSSFFLVQCVCEREREIKIRKGAKCV